MPTLDVSQCHSVGSRPACSGCELLPGLAPISLLNQVALGQVYLVLSWTQVCQNMTQSVFSSQRHGYCTLGEAFNRLDFSSAILDSRRFNYVVRVSQSPGFILM